jgi:hypothetical protein
MTPENSFLVDCDEDFVKPHEQAFPFDSTMRWGHPRQEDLLAKILLAKAMCDDGRIKSKIERARADLTEFSTAAVGQMMVDRLSQIASSLESSQRAAD